MFIEALKSESGPVLITGHTGFKGTWLSLFLNRLNIETYGLSLAAEPGSLYQRIGGGDLLSGEIGDIRDIDLLGKTFKKVQPSIIIHLAAQPLVLKSYKYPLETFETNVIGTANVLKTAFDTPTVKVVLVITTDKVYRNDDIGKRFKEVDPLLGKDPYSASKVGAESVCAAWQQISKVSGGPAVIVARAGNVIGGGDFAEDRIIPDIIRGLISERPTVIRNPHSTRPWQHVLDPLGGYLLYIDRTLQKNISIPALNFGPKEASLEVTEILRIGNDVLGDSAKFVVNEGEFDKEARALELDSNLAHQSLMWSPKWSQKAAIKDTFTWWKSVLDDPKTAHSSCIRDIDFFLSTSQE